MDNTKWFVNPEVAKQMMQNATPLMKVQSDADDQAWERSCEEKAAESYMEPTK